MMFEQASWQCPEYRLSVAPACLPPLEYLAPEYITEPSSLTPSADMFSLGALATAVFNKGRPYTAHKGDVEGYKKAWKEVSRPLLVHLMLAVHLVYDTLLGLVPASCTWFRAHMVAVVVNSDSFLVAYWENENIICATLSCWMYILLVEITCIFSCSLYDRKLLFILKIPCPFIGCLVVTNVKSPSDGCTSWLEGAGAPAAPAQPNCEADHPTAGSGDCCHPPSETH